MYPEPVKVVEKYEEEKRDDLDGVIKELAAEEDDSDEGEDDGCEEVLLEKDKDRLSTKETEREKRRYDDLVDIKQKIDEEVADLTFNEVNKFNNPLVVCDLNCLDAKEAERILDKHVRELAQLALDQHAQYNMHESNNVVMQIVTGFATIQEESKPSNDRLQGLIKYKKKQSQP